MSSTSMFFDIFGRDKGVGEMMDKVAHKGAGITTVLGGIGSAGAALGLGEVFKTGLDEAMETQTAMAQLEAGIESTGGQAGVTAEEMKTLAESIEQSSGMSKEAVMHNESLLLTFTNIKNTGPDKIFDDATVAVQNMAAKMGGDGSAQALALGKALNDPIKGMTALRRVGVQFTAAQQDQIKAMVESGDTIGAQKVMLGELKTEFGGAAEAAGKTLPGQLAIAKATFRDISETLVTGLMPTLQSLMKHVQDVMNWFKNLSPEMQHAITMALGIIGVVGPLILIISKMSGAVREVISVVKDFRAGFIALQAVLAANPFILIIIGIGLLVAGLIWAYNNVGWFKDFVNSAFKIIQDIVGTVIGYITGTLIPNLVAGWNQISDAVGAVSSFISTTWSGIQTNTSEAIGNVVGFFVGLPSRILGALGNMGSLLLGIGGQIIQGLKDGISGALGGLGDVLGAVGKFITDHKGPESHDRQMLVPHGGWIMGGLIGSIRNSIPGLKDTLGLVSDTITDHLAGTSFDVTGTGGLSLSAGLSSSQTPQPVIVYATMTNPLTGEEIRQVIHTEAEKSVSLADRDAARRRIG